MKRILLVLTVAALMAAMMVNAGLAKAGVFIGGSSFDVGDDDAGGFNNAFFFLQWNSELDDFAPGGIEYG